MTHVVNRSEHTGFTTYRCRGCRVAMRTYAIDPSNKAQRITAFYDNHERDIACVGMVQLARNARSMQHRLP